jgi:hypothetical protein
MHSGHLFQTSTGIRHSVQIENQKHRIIKSLKQTKTLRFCRMTKATALCEGWICRKGDVQHLIGSHGFMNPWQKKCHNYNWETNAETTSANRAILPSNLKQTATPHHSELVHLYRLPQIHKTEVPLWPSEFHSFTTLCLGWFLHNTVIPINGKSKSSVWNSEHLI